MAAVNYFRNREKVIAVDGRPSVGEVSRLILERIP